MLKFDEQVTLCFNISGKKQFSNYAIAYASKNRVVAIF